MAMCYNSDCERVEHYSCKQCDCNIAHQCEEYVSGRPTNADHIRAMSDEGLAEFAIMSSKFFCTRKEPEPCEKPMSCTACALAWLKLPTKDKNCERYVGMACVDGTCPMAAQDEYEEHCIPAIRSCEECWKYRGCEDCALEGTEYCDKGEVCDTKPAPSAAQDTTTL